MNNMFKYFYNKLIVYLLKKLNSQGILNIKI